MQMDELTVHHAHVLAVLHQGIFSDSWDTDAFLSLLATPGTFGFIAVVETGENEHQVEYPAGFILLRVVADEAEIITLVVAPDHRRQGIAAALLARARVEARARGAARLFLEVGAGNIAASALYHRAGFKEAGLRPGYYRKGHDGKGRTEDAHVLVCGLDS